MQNILQTSRLDLREMSPDDIDFLATMLADPEVMRFYPTRLSRDEALSWIERYRALYAACGFGFWLVIDRRTGEAAGQVGLTLCEIDGVREPGLGYLLHRPFWGRGLATEAARGVLDWAFESRNLERVICPIRPENVRSLRVAARLRLSPEKHVLYCGFPHLVFIAERRRARN